MLRSAVLRAGFESKLRLCSMLVEMRAKEVAGDKWNRFQFPPGFKFDDMLKLWKPTELIPKEGDDPREDFSSVC
jgi:hypothetical protein